MPGILQTADVGDDRLQLRLGERLAERRHRALLARLDAVQEELVRPLTARELGAATGGPPAVLVAPAARRGEQFLAVDGVGVGLPGGRRWAVLGGGAGGGADDDQEGGDQMARSHLDSSLHPAGRGRARMLDPARAATNRR